MIFSIFNSSIHEKNVTPTLHKLSVNTLSAERSLWELPPVAQTVLHPEKHLEFLFNLLIFSPQKGWHVSEGTFGTTTLTYPIKLLFVTFYGGLYRFINSTLFRVIDTLQCKHMLLPSISLLNILILIKKSCTHTVKHIGGVATPWGRVPDSMGEKIFHTEGALVKATLHPDFGHFFLISSN